MLQCDQISYRRHSELLLQPSTVHLSIGQKVGLIGPNGCGKSTFLAVLRGEVALLSGDITAPKVWRWSFLEQQIDDLNSSVLTYVLKGHPAFYQIYEQLQTAELNEDWETVAFCHQALSEAQWYDEPARAQTLLSGLGFKTEQCQQTMAEQSGGWRVRAALAKALYMPSDILCLDEPTNHLDIGTLIWLERFLQQYPGLLIIISHDAAFLDQITNRTVAFEQGTLVTYEGGYTQALKTRAERIALQNKHAQKQEKKIAHLMSYVERFRAKASKAKQAQSRLKQIERMTRILAVREHTPFQFEFLPIRPTGTPMLRLEKADLGYLPGSPILKGVDMYLAPGDRVGIVGNNGAGKSTLAKSLVGEIALLSGEYHRVSNLQIGYFAQHQVEQLPADHTLVRCLQDRQVQWKEIEVRRYLGQFGFSGDQIFQTISTLSGGEKARLVLALIVLEAPNILILDEPTNHFDLEMREALSMALQAYEGAVLVISHDRQFLSDLVDGYYHIDRGQCIYYEDWSSIVWQVPHHVNTIVAQKTASRQSAISFEDTARTLKQLEKQLEQLEMQLAVWELEMADPKWYASTITKEEKASWEQLKKQHAEGIVQRQKLEETWFDLSQPDPQSH